MIAQMKGIDAQNTLLMQKQSYHVFPGLKHVFSFKIDPEPLQGNIFWFGIDIWHVVPLSTLFLTCLIDSTRSQWRMKPL